MKIREIIGKEIDVDVFDDYSEELGIAYCGNTLTPAGEKKVC